MSSVGRRLASHAAGLVAAVLWSALVAVLVVLGTIGLGISGPSGLIAVQGMVPLMLLAIPVGGVVAGLLRRPPLAVACGAVTLALAGACMGPASADGPPEWARDAPRLTVVAANLRYDNPSWREAVGTVTATATDADVVVLNEVTPQVLAELRRRGAFRDYPVRAVSSMADGFGELVMARRGAVDAEVEALGPLNAPALTVSVGGRPVRVLAVHCQAPSSGWARPRWFAQHEALRERALRRGEALLLLGDFNATAWHEPFRHLLGAGLADAHDERGQGLSRSWGPLLDERTVLGPLLRIDHGVASRELAAVTVADRSVPGSDHRAQRIVYAVRPGSGRPR